MTGDTTGGEGEQLDGAALGGVLHSLRRRGRADGLDEALRHVQRVSEKYDKLFAGPMLSGPEARRIFRQAADEMAKALRAAKRLGDGGRRQVEKGG